MSTFEKGQTVYDKSGKKYEYFKQIDEGHLAYQMMKYIVSYDDDYGREDECAERGELVLLIEPLSSQPSQEGCQELEAKLHGLKSEIFDAEVQLNKIKSDILSEAKKQNEERERLQQMAKKNETLQAMYDFALTDYKYVVWQSSNEPKEILSYRDWKSEVDVAKLYIDKNKIDIKVYDKNDHSYRKGMPFKTRVEAEQYIVDSHLSDIRTALSNNSKDYILNSLKNRCTDINIEVPQELTDEIARRDAEEKEIRIQQIEKELSDLKGEAA